MIKVSVLYPNKPGARFDHDYYRDQHMPLVQRLLGEGCRSYSVDRGLGGGAPGQDAPFIAMCHIYSDSPESFGAAFAPHAKTITADVKNYTDIEPLMQVSEVVVEG
jgi:uncharacterized protein (TIGR02118 family)